MLLLDLLEVFWDNYWCSKPGCPCTGMHAAIQSTCAVLPTCFWSVVPAGEASDHQSTADPPSAASPKAPGATDSMWTCLQEDLLWTSDHRTSHVLLLLSNQSFIISASLSSHAESTTLPKILNLAYIISLHVDFILGHCKRQGENCPTGLLVQGANSYPTLPVLFLTHY